jgi:hypothetical protein
MKHATRAASGAAAAAALALGQGCIFSPEFGAFRAGWHPAMTVEGDTAASDGEAWGVEITGGVGGEPAERPVMGPLFFGFGFSQAEMGQGPTRETERRFGVRARSSMLSRPTRHYPYAAVGAYLGHIERPGGDRAGIGVEGGYGLRLALGGHAALDLEALYSYGFYDAGYEAASGRFGLGLTLVW